MSKHKKWFIGVSMLVIGFTLSLQFEWLAEPQQPTKLQHSLEADSPFSPPDRSKADAMPGPAPESQGDSLPTLQGHM